MKRQVGRALVAILIGAVPSPVAAVAHAQTGQVSGADKKAARDLYFQGSELQQQGKYAEALDRFQRAQSVFPAPTHLLHIAECHAALGHLVESAEAYRTLSRMQLGSGAPAAFQAAQAQGAAELPQIEPRIPSLKIDVTPANAQSLDVRIDDQPISAALIGVPRPVDPGTHKVSVAAADHGRSEQTVTLRERETKTLSFVLQPSAPNVAAPPPYVILPAPMGGTGAPAGAAGGQNGPGAAQLAAPPPAYEARVSPPRSSSGYMIGARVGVLFPGGSVDAENKLDERAGTGGAFALEGGVRFAHIVILQLALEGGVLSGPSRPRAVEAGTSATFEATTTLASATVGIVTNPARVGFIGEIGAGYRTLTLTETLNVGAASQKREASLSGPEFLVGGGIYIRATEALRIVPKIQFGLGAFGSADCESNLGRGAAQSFCATGNTIARTAGHTFVLLGVGVYFGHDAAPK